MADNKAAKKTIYTSQEALYEKAVLKMNADQVIVQHAYKIDNYLVAASMFDEVGDYLDAPEMAEKCRELAKQTREDEKAQKYSRCIARMEGQTDTEKYKKIAEELESLGKYRDAESYAKKCREYLRLAAKKHRLKRNGVIAGIILAAGLIVAGAGTGFFRYVMGFGLMKSGKYAQAQAIFREMPGFLHSDEYLDQCIYERLMNAKVDDPVEFGAFKWKVLDIENDVLKLMAIDVGSQHIFYQVPFHETMEPVTWEDCSLRKWLNTEVYEEYFSDEERSHMLLQTSGSSVNEDYQTSYPEETQDYLTVLSVEEASDYMEAISTMGLDFWFRTPGNAEDTACYISAPTHTIRSYGCPVNQIGVAVRPVIEVDRASFR